MFRSQSGPYNPLLEKFNEAHIDKYLDYMQRDDDNEYQIKKSNRWFSLVYFILILIILTIGIVYLLPRDKDLLIFIIQVIIILAGGIGAGYGLKSRERD